MSSEEPKIVLDQAKLDALKNIKINVPKFVFPKVTF